MTLPLNPDPVKRTRAVKRGPRRRVRNHEWCDQGEDFWAIAVGQVNEVANG